jgi:hypothetical protein
MGAKSTLRRLRRETPIMARAMRSRRQKDDADSYIFYIC